MKITLWLFLAACLYGQPLAQRIGRSGSAKYFRVVHGHGGAGEQKLTDLIEGVHFMTNIRWRHKGWLMPMSGIGHHFHHSLEDMFVIFGGEARYTVGGRTAARYRRLLGPEIFTTNRSYLDHIALPPGSSIGSRRHTGLEEIYYVLNGTAIARVENESEPVRRGGAAPVLLTYRGGEVHSIENKGTEDLELMVIGVALEKGKFETTDVQ
jgi:mannose-6-phosphate isomerase-like protein (cupin superfamily)